MYEYMKTKEIIIIWSERMGYRGAEAFFLPWMTVKPADELSSVSLRQKTGWLFASCEKYLLLGAVGVVLDQDF